MSRPSVDETWRAGYLSGLYEADAWGPELGELRSFDARMDLRVYARGFACGVMSGAMRGRGAVVG